MGHFSAEIYAPPGSTLNGNQQTLPKSARTGCYHPRFDRDYAKLSRPQSVAWLNRCLETSATCFDCCLSQEILDGGNGVLTT